MADKTHIPRFTNLLFGFLGIGFISLGVPTLINNTSLRRSKAVAEARVIDSRTKYTKYPSYGNPDHDIQYVLILNGVEIPHSDWGNDYQMGKVKPLISGRSGKSTERGLAV